jgi:hypothetical protein
MRTDAPFLKNKTPHATNAAAVPNLIPTRMHATTHVTRRPSAVLGRSLIAYLLDIKYMPVPVDQGLYRKVKARADKIYTVPSAYKSGWIVKTYKSLGGKYENDNKVRSLRRWFKEKWVDIGHKQYPVYRPTKRISKKTPLTVSEIDPKQAKRQIRLKQTIGHKSLPKFNSLYFSTA